MGAVNICQFRSFAGLFLLYLHAMKIIECSKSQEEVLTEVMRISANAALQRGDAAHVATEDNEELLGAFFEEVKAEVVLLLSKYINSDLAFSMPENWDFSLEKTLKAIVKSVLVYGVLAKWYALSGDSVYGDMFSSTIEEILSILRKRVKPVRDGRK